MVDQNAGLGTRKFVQWLINSSLGSRNVVQWLINSGLGSRSFVQWLNRTLVLDPGILFSG